MEWVWDDTPTTGYGHYAVAVCWDINEGIIRAVNYWGNEGWFGRDPIAGHAGPFGNREEADDWLKDHDPEGI